MTEKWTPDVDGSLRYLRTGGLGEVVGLIDVAMELGTRKVQSDADMAMALCMLANNLFALEDICRRVLAEIDNYYAVDDGSPNIPGEIMIAVSEMRFALPRECARDEAPPPTQMEGE